ncbi:hypothetical protein FMM01_12685 [Schleiferilactobacillus harbinensis]|uniref:hypothetical protein n=1 Tax=Schleiferilactobacillus harbinensis TaxID=304207 RepID=UPI00123C1443|nr:hypothetical protein [Schleiferilactobacillus harbinensis]QEU48095.1 hypothetical protein FMM01_12685 [Schleiferilactobacillus harbinensis]
MKQWMVKFSGAHPYVSVVLRYTAYVIIVIAIGLIFHLSIGYDGIYYLVFIVIGHLFYVRHQRNKK